MRPIERIYMMNKVEYYKALMITHGQDKVIKFLLSVINELENKLRTNNETPSTPRR